MSRRSRHAKQKRRAKRRAAPGSAPGTLVVDPEAPKPRLRVMAYGEGTLQELERPSIAEARALLGKHRVVWLNVDGLGDVEFLQQLGERFDLHLLTLEDVVNTSQRPKLEVYEGHLYLVTQMIVLQERLETEQVSLFLGDGFVLTVQEREGDCFDPVRERIRHGRGQIRGAGPDYLLYALLDAVVDSYFPLLEAYGERIEELEQEVLEQPSTEDVARIRDTKRDLLLLRRTIWPQRDVLHLIARDPGGRIEESTVPYLNDVYDHVVRIMDILETYRELAAGLMDTYLSILSHRMNEVMRVLTIIATIFIPLTFIAGIYGMNFHAMPELGWTWGYPACLAVMAATTAGLILFFKRKGWIGGD